MIDVEQFEAELNQMPLLELEQMSQAINKQISQKHAKLAEDEDAEHMQIVAERIVENEADNVDMVPFEESINRVFGKL